MKKILYFVRGGVPAPEQKEEAKALGAVFRNSSVSGNDFVERCDAVAGDVPERYKHFPRVGSMEQQAEESMPSIVATVEPPVDAMPGQQAEPQQELAQEQAAVPSVVPSRIEEYRAALMEKTVKELREIAKANGIPLPADINTKEEIADYVSVRLAQS